MANNNNNSDYTKPRMDLYELLPEVYKSNTNKSIFGNLFNRFLTKQEVRTITGYLGEGNPNAVVKRQIEEPTLHRQAFQLQPIMYDKIGSVEHMASWKDIINELERLGIDIDDIDKWGELLQFNWVPPIDIDKLIHFEDYYWYDEETPNSKPQYLTIRSRCTTAIANANFWESIIKEYGETIPIQEIGNVDDYRSLPTYAIDSIELATNTIIVTGNASVELKASNLFDVAGTASNNGIHQVLSSPTYDDILDVTTIQVQPGTITFNENNIGTLVLRRFDKIKLQGNYSSLFEPDFVFFVTGSSNVELNDSFWKVATSEFNDITNLTSVQVTSVITDNTAGGVVSLEEQLNFYLAEKDCQCSGSIGWDILQWDDNPAEPVLWGSTTDSSSEDHATLITSISNPSSPVGVGINGQLWYDTSGDRLYQYDGTEPDVLGWKPLWNNFSLILEKTNGFALWDSTIGCGITTIVETAAQWSNQNKWLHKSDVPSYSIAKQAQIPIIEYDWDLELNEWTYTDYTWKYRKDKFSEWEETQINPSLIELIPIEDWTEDTDVIILDERYGDLTSWFTVGAKFQAEGVDDIFIVENSTYSASSSGAIYQTRITITVPFGTSNLVPGVTPLRPYRTSLDDPWKVYGDQWLFVGQENTVPVPHKTFNIFAEISPLEIPELDLSGDFELATSYYAQNWNIITATTLTKFDLSSDLKTETSRSLRQRAQLGTDDIRVYINDVRQYGTYDELDDDGFDFVTGINFLPGFTPIRFDQVRVEVGEATYEDFGKYSVPVRMEEDNNLYISNVDVTLIQYRKVEQVKTKTNQYPLFDIYNVDGSPANKANAIFGYRTDSSYDVNVNVGLRIVHDPITRLFEYDQFLIEEDNGILYAYRDYSNDSTNLWLNPTTNELKFWTGLNWDSKKDVDNHYIPAIVSDAEPSDTQKLIDGLYWVDTISDKVFTRDVIGNNWDEVTTIDVENSDITLQTIWKKGLNDETYIPDMVDWEGRSEDEYQAQKELYITERVEELLLTDNSLTLPEAITQATSEWSQRQSNVHSVNGAWIGDWEIPDPMYFNNANENRKFLTSREVLTHFNTIIQAQPRIPGYSGPSEGMFHLITTDDVNYGLGGKIKQYNNSFDTMLSSTFVNNVTPLSLINFAHDQYETLLNGLREIYRKNAISLLTTTTVPSLINLTGYISDEVIGEYELNDNATFVYGDSTTYTEVEDGKNLGVHNWIATLPYLQLVRAVVPTRLIDASLGINQVVHHDGHRNDYFLTSATVENIIRIVIDYPDNRTRFPGPDDPPLDTFGRRSLTDLPPNNISDFSSEFNTTILGREGVYWYYSPPTGTRTFYRLAVAEAGDQEPSSILPDDTLWMDLDPGNEVLRIKVTDSITNVSDWIPVEGLSVGDGRLHNGTDPSDVTTATISAWVETNLDVILGDIIFDLENRLYENAPDPTSLRYDFDETKNDNQTKYYEYLQQSFFDYTTQQGIIDPLSNVDYSQTLPFTWNYKFSTIGAGIQIIDASSVSNSFSVSGDVTSQPGFDAPGVSFYIKNSGVNDGTWTIVSPSAIYDIGNDLTKIYVAETVTDSVDGVLYSGQLPSSKNDGSESGGDWRDYYEKLYGTPFPHLEPWILQGYTDKPSWWDTEYLNDNEDATWGDRTWKYKHGFNITGIDLSKEQFDIVGDFSNVFLTGDIFAIDHSAGVYDGTYTVDSKDTIASSVAGVTGTGSIEIAGNVTIDYPIGLRFVVVDSLGNSKGEFTVKQRVYSGPPNNVTIIITEEDIDDVTDFDFISGGFYNPTTNTTSIKVINDLTINSVEGRIVIAYGMWRNIAVGVIPPGRSYSNGVVSVTGNPVTDDGVYNLSTPTIPTYNYFSVNIDNDSVSADGGTTNYSSDAVFPPYWNFIGHFGGSIPSFDRNIRSVFFNFNVEITSPGTDYSFGDSGPVEWQWSQLSQWMYDQLSVSYRLDPIKYVSGTFGIDFITIAGLDIDSRQERVLCHCRTDFHGDIINNEPYSVAGTNQWYVNFNRRGGYDASSSDFRSLWTQWSAPLTYQFSSFIDTPSLSVGHRGVDITEFDYSIIAKKSPGVDDFWLDALDVTVISIPPNLARYDNQLDWKMEINTNLPISRDIEYYDVQNYQFYADPETNICTLNAWLVQDLDIFNSTFSVQGNQTKVFIDDMTFTISGSTGNDGAYQVVTSAYNAVTDETIIDVDTTISSNVRDGLIIANYRTIPWTTGFGIYLSSAETLPVPLQGDTINGLTKYFIIVDSSNTFRLANTLQDAENGNEINITAPGRRDQFVGAVTGTFQALNGERTNVNWRHYSTDNRYLVTLNTPYDMQGMQTLVNIVDGLDIRLREDGWKINEDSSLNDPISGRLVSWQLELERFISYAYGLRVQQYQVKDRYEATIDVATDVWTFVEADRQFITGDKVSIFSSNSIYPDPILSGIRYYIIRDSLTEFRLAATKKDAESGIAFDITSSVGVDKLYVMSAKQVTRSSPSHEINPFRHSVWYRPSRGIISNIITGPSEDVRTTQLIFDQNGHPLGIDKLRIFREDKQTAIGVIEGNELNNLPINQNPYDDIHLGGLHLFIDSFEHVMKFNNYTSQDIMIYDSFIGLNVTKFETVFNRMVEFTGRPNIGGYYLETFFNQGAELNRNIEASVEDIRTLYDTYTVLETNPLMVQSRKVLGYEGTRNYLDNLNLNAKSQFLFWKGQIQYKGSVNAVNAFINSRRFIDAKVDEFWALKIAEFGSSAEKEYPEMYVTTTDARSNDFRMQFVVGDTEVEDTFTPIRLTDEERWYNQPDQLSTLRNNGQNLYFELEVSDSVPVIVSGFAGAPLDGVDRQGLIVDGTWNGMAWVQDLNDSHFYTYDEGNTTWESNGSWDSSTGTPTLRHNFKSDTVVITLNLYSDGITFEYTTTGTSLTVDKYIPGSGGISVFKGVYSGGDFVDGIPLTLNVDYVEVPVAGQGYSTEIILNEAIVSGTDYIQIAHGTSNLVEGTNFVNVNSNIAQILDLSLIDLAVFPGLHNLKIWGMTINKDTQNPARLLDKISEVVLSTIQFWDPARNYHDSNAIHNIDLQNDNDSAFYTYTPELQPEPIQGQPKVTPWGNAQVGVTWLDTTNMDYLPYYDTEVVPDFQNRLRAWGQLVSWGNIVTWEWVKSNVSPEDYNAAAEADAGNINIPDEVRKSGTVRYELFNLLPTNYVISEVNLDGNYIVVTGDLTDITEIGKAVTIRNSINNTTDDSNDGPYRIQTLTVSGGNTTLVFDDILTTDSLDVLGELYPLWQLAQNKYEEQDAIIEGTYDAVNTTCDFVLTSFIEDDIVNVYVDGRISVEDAVVGAGSVINDVICQELSRVRFAQLVPTDETVIDAGIEAGTILRDYEYTSETYFDEFGSELPVYYFWVNDKSVKSSDKNRTLPMNETQTKLVSGSTPHIIFKNRENYDDVIITGNSTTPRFELQTTVVDQTVFVVELPIAENVVISINIDGVPIPTNEISYVANERNITITTPLLGNEPAEIRYEGSFGSIIEIPPRFTQAIIRGLRGWIDADRRYTIRFTRDFTLRDNLDTGTSPLNLKNLHEEWEMFRQHQPYHIRRDLWDRITEAMVGYKLTDSTKRVPSYERELYDDKFGTDTQYGLEDDQAFTSGPLALTTVISDLQNPANNFQPIDINVFFSRHSFDTNENIVESMNTIYNTFSHEHVNRIMFSVIYDAFSLKDKYPDLFKTSMVSLHGIRPFQVAGLWDD